VRLPDWEARETEYPTKAPSRSSQRGLDWFAFFIADIQTGFGPFLSVYLTTQKWTQVDIGLVLSIGSFASLLGSGARRLDRRSGAIEAARRLRLPSSA